MSAMSTMRERQARFDTAPRPPAQLPRDDGLGWGLHATSRPRWRIDWARVMWWAWGLVSCAIYALAVVGVASLWVRP